MAFYRAASQIRLRGGRFFYSSDTPFDGRWESPEGDILAVGFVWEDSGRWLRQPGQTDWLPPGSATPIEKNDRLEGEYHLTILVRPDTSRDDYVRTLSAWAKAKWRISESPEIWWL
ncbi:MAG: hypothetical protein Q7T61_16065 [Caulobacter sp.]|nr:hypothetical protein [Caulobacter sp.]